VSRVVGDVVGDCGEGDAADACALDGAEGSAIGFVVAEGLRGRWGVVDLEGAGS